MEVARKLLIKRVVHVILLVSVLIATAIFFIKGEICMMIAGVGNIFFLLWLASADPLKTGIRIKTKTKNIEFLICALLIWVAAYLFMVKGLCEILAEILRAARTMIPI